MSRDLCVCFALRSRHSNCARFEDESESFSEDGNESNVYHDSFWPSHHQQHQHPPPTQSMGIQYPSGYAYYSAPSRSAQSYSPYLHHPHTHLPQPSMLHYQAGAYPSYYPPHPAQGLAQDRTIPPSGYSYNSFEPSSSTLSNSTGYNISMREGEITGRPPVALYMPCDENSLSEYQCLVRRQIELFEATRHDVESSAQGRNRPIVLGQVGIRCIHCRMLATKRKARGATYYPAKLIGLYQVSQAISRLFCYVFLTSDFVTYPVSLRLRRISKCKSDDLGLCDLNKELTLFRFQSELSSL